MFRFIVSIIVIVLGALTQFTSVASIYGVKPNIVLILLLIFSSTYTNWLERSILIFISALMLKFGSGLETQNILFIVSSCVGVMITDKFPFPKLINLTLALLTATFIINILDFEFWRVILEFSYNILIILLSFGIYKFLNKLWLKR